MKDLANLDDLLIAWTGTAQGLTEEDFLNLSEERKGFCKIVPLLLTRLVDASQQFLRGTTLTATPLDAQSMFSSLVGIASIEERRIDLDLDHLTMLAVLSFVIIIEFSKLDPDIDHQVLLSSIANHKTVVLANQLKTEYERILH